MFVPIFLVLYVVVALCNYSLVQSYIARYAGVWLSEKSGGKISIGSVVINPLGQVVVRRAQIVDPKGDTIANADKISVRFHQKPITEDGLRLDAANISGTYYHFATVLLAHNGDTVHRTNLQFLIDALSSEKPKEPKEPSTPFAIMIKRVTLRDVHYKQDLASSHEHIYPHGVNIQHMDYRDINARFKNVHVKESNVDCRVISMSTIEKSGFHLRDFSADVSVSPYHIHAKDIEINTDSTRLMADATLDWPEFWNMKDFCNDVDMYVRVKPGSVCGLSDAAFWAPTLWGIDERIAVEGTFHGPVADMYAENVTASFGSESELYMDAHIQGLPDIAQTTIDAEISRLHTSYQDLADVHHPEGVTMKMAGLLRQLDRFDIEAEFHGGCNDCKAAVNVYSTAASLSVDVAIAYDEKAGDYAYTADINSSNIDISSVVKNEWISRTGMAITVHGVGFDPKTMRASAEGELLNTIVRNNRLDVTTFTAEVENHVAKVDLSLTDSLVHLAMNASMDLEDSIPFYNGTISLKKCDLTGLHLIPESDDHTVVDMEVDADVTGNTLNTMVGNIRFSDLAVRANGDSLKVKDLQIALDRNRHNRKQMTVKSDLLKGELTGYFDYENVPLLVRQFCDNYLPTYYNPYADDPAVDATSIADNFFNIDVRYLGSPDQLQALVPSLKLAKNTSVHCSYNYMEPFKLVLRSDSVSMGSVVLRDVGLLGTPTAESYNVNLDAGKMLVGTVELLDKVDLDVASEPSAASLCLKWGESPSAKNRGDLDFLMTSSTEGNMITISRPTFFIDGDRWTIVCPEGANIAANDIRIGQTKISGNGQSAVFDAMIAHKYNDQVNVTFSNFKLGYLMKLLVQNDQYAMNGTLNGRGSLYGMGSSPYFNASVQIDDFTMGGQSLGMVDAVSTWNAELNQLNLHLTSHLDDDGGGTQPLIADGFIELGGKDPAVDFNVKLDDFNLSTLTPFSASFSSKVAGRVSGDVDVHGTFGKPTIAGGLYVHDGDLLVDATGVEYTFTDSIYISDNRIRLRDFQIKDPRDNTAHANGELDCSNLSNIKANISLKSPNFMVLNSARGESYYGTLLVGIDGLLSGPLDRLDISGNISTRPGSTVTVPIDNHRTVSTQDYITFVSDQTAGTENENTAEKTVEKEESKLHVSAKINATPDLRLNIPVEMSQMFLTVSASGEGELYFDLTDGKPRVTGNYELVSGSTLNLNLAQLVSRKFNIEEGSLLEFPGNIEDARFDLSAVYSLRTNVSSLTGGLASGETSQKTITVEDVFLLSGTVNDPKVSFDIRLPNADQSVSEEVFAYIDRNDERTMLNQSVSLLVLGQFSNVSGTSEAESSAAETGYATVLNTMGNLVSSMVKFVDLNFDYKAATAATNEQYELDISKSWNKFYFESSFGYGGNSRDFVETNGSNNIVGDMLVGYKLTPRVHFFVFNRSNTNDYTRTDLPYKQGMGLKFTHDFDKFSDMFHRKSKNQ